MAGLADIFIVGTGIVSVRQITPEVVAAIRKSNEVFYLDTTVGIHDFLKNNCERVTDLHGSSYREGNGRIEAYNVMAATVIEAAIDHPPVTFALYGHPLVYALPPFKIIEASKLLGLSVKIYPGISSLDTLFIDLQVDPATQGLQMYEATDLLLRERPLQADVPCVLWQVGTVETELYSAATNTPARFHRLRDYLLKFYPPEHVVTVVSSSTHPLIASQRCEFPLKDISHHSESLHQGATMYIPAAAVRGIVNEEMASQLSSRSHLAELVGPSPTQES